jgi:hypothetical protein
MPFTRSPYLFHVISTPCGSDRFEQAVIDFAVAYAGQNKRDHAALAEAAASGRVHAQTGV